jgi:hypothetical protein
MRLPKFTKQPAFQIWLAKEWLFFRWWIVCSVCVPLACVAVFLFNGMNVDDPAIGTTAGMTCGIWIFTYFVRLILHIAHVTRIGLDQANRWAKKTVSPKDLPQKPQPENPPHFENN